MHRAEEDCVLVGMQVKEKVHEGVFSHLAEALLSPGLSGVNMDPTALAAGGASGGWAVLIFLLSSWHDDTSLFTCRVSDRGHRLSLCCG